MKYPSFQVLASRTEYLKRVVKVAPEGLSVINVARNDIRRWHTHTMHPLELTEFLNGIDLILYSSLFKFNEEM